MVHATHGVHPHLDSNTELPLPLPLPRESSPSPPPPTKASLKAWWNQFKFMQRMKVGAGDHTATQKALTAGYSHNYGASKDDGPHPVFGAPLNESLKYAAVQISTANSNGELYVWGDIPVVVAKCGLYLKETATEVEGTFRVSGSNKRMRDLQALFEAPPKYGKNLDWKKENYTPHDVASVFRRYLTQMPEPVIPYNLYSKFREPLAKKMPTDDVIKAYKQLIRSMPRQNQYLLLYVLDLLSVFARKADKNLMTATNLAVIFRPGLISHPQHELSPNEHALSQEVLEFLIEHQDWFMLDVPPPPPRNHSYQNTNVSGQHALPTIPDEEREREREREREGSGSPHPTVISMASGWRLVEKPAISAEQGSGSAQTGGASGRRGSKSGRRRSSSAASSGEARISASGHGHGHGGHGHVRMASTEAPAGSGGERGQAGGAVAVTRSRTLPPRAERSRKDNLKDNLSRDRDREREKDRDRGKDLRERDKEREQRHRERDRESKEKDGNLSSGGAAGARNVLKKQKRASMQNQRIGGVGGLLNQGQQQLVTVPPPSTTAAQRYNNPP